MRMMIAALCAPLLGVPAFAQAPALVPGTTSLDIVDAGHQHARLDALYAEAVSNALTDVHFLVLPGEGHGRYITRVTVSQEARGSVTARGPSGGGAQVVGGRLGVSLPTSNTQLSGLIITRLDLNIASRETGKTVWTGSASTAQVEGTRAGAPAAVAKKLAESLLKRFPQQIEGPISVP